MWLPAVKIGDGKYLLSTVEARRAFMKFIESAILCNEVKNEDGSSSLMFASAVREENAALVEPFCRWFGVNSDLKKQFELTKQQMEESGRVAAAGISGIVRGGGGGNGSGEVSH